MANVSSPLILYRGPKASIDAQSLEDGALYFSTDTKQIYLDCNFVDKEGEKIEDRIAFSGSSGIFYGNKTFESSDVEFLFSLEDFVANTTTELPGINDLILNKDGAFFRVISVETNDQGIELVRCLKLTVAGGGGGGGYGGGSAITAKKKGSSSLILTEKGSAALQYVVYDPEDPEAIIGMNFYIDSKLVETFSFVDVSADDNDIKSFDLTPYVKLFPSNAPSIVSINFTDINGQIVSATLNYTVRQIKLSVEQTMNLGIYETNFPYECKVNFDESVEVKEKTVFTYQIINSDYDQFITEKSISIAGISSGGTVSPIIDYYGDGNYEIRCWLTAELTINNNVVKVDSNVISQSFIFQQNSDTPILSATFPTGTFEQYDLDATVTYIIGYKNATVPFRRKVIVTDSEGKESVLFTDSGDEPTKVKTSWTIELSKVGTYKVILEILSGANVITSSSGEFTVKAFSGSGSASVPIISTGVISGLKLDLRAKGKSNSASDYNTWVSKVEGIEKDTVCKLTDGFNWITNGWKTSSDGASLHLDNGAKLVVPYSVFTNAAGSSATESGRTIEIDVKISNVRDRFKHWLTCASEKIDESTGEVEAIYTGLYGNGEAVCLNSNETQPIKTLDTKGARVSEAESGYIARFEEGTRVHLTFVITPAGRTIGVNIPSNMVYVYIDGVISGLANYGKSVFSQGTPTSYIIFDSSYADVDVYNIRVYDTVLGHRAVLQNYLASQDDMQTSIKRWKDNGVAIYDDNQPERGYHVSLKAVKAAKNIPYMVFRGGVPCDKKGVVNLDKKNIASLPGDGLATQTDPESLKEDYRLMDVYYVDPEDSKNDIASAEARTKMVVYPQGTSSMGYPVKNLRIQMIEGEYKDGYKLYDNLPPVNLFCLKADYMESSSANNTGTGNILNALYGTLKTPAQVVDPNHVTAIMGRPIVCFFKPMKYEDQYEYKDENGSIVEYPENLDDDADYIYIGRYNFNLDKKTPEPFGFYSDIDNHYGVNLDYGANKSIMNLVKENNFIDLLKQLPVKAGFQATTDETYDPNKTYYYEPNFEAEQFVSTVWDSIVDKDNITKEEEKALEKEFCSYLETAPLYTYHTAKEGTNSIQCWECLTNTHALTRLQTPWDEEKDKVQQILERDPNTGEEKLVTKYYYDWTSAFESRYPKYAEEQASDKRAFSTFVNWVASTNQAVVQHEPSESERETNPNGLTPLFPSEDNPLLPAKNENGELLYKGSNDNKFYYDSKEYRLYKFANEFDDHMHRDFTFFYYILTELFIMMDSRAKNMMLCSFDADNDARTGIWFPIFYDMDTACGLDNTGKLIYRYDEEDYFRGVYNASAGYEAEDGLPNDSYSTLWCNIREAVNKNLNNFKTDMDDLYLRLRSNNLTEDNLIKYYNLEQANAWNETYINYDEEYKYILPYLAGSTTAKLFAAQGTRSPYRSQLLKKRLQYIDAKRGYGPWAINLPDGRVNKFSESGNLDFEFTAANSTYIGYSFTNGQQVDRHIVREGDTIKFSGPRLNTGIEEQEIFLFTLNNLSDLGDLSYKYFSAFKLDVSEKNKGHYSKVHTLKFGRHGEPDFATHFENKPKILTDLSALAFFPMLEKLDIAYLPGLNGSVVELSTNKYLKQVYAEGTKLTSLPLPEGGVLEEVFVPKTLQKLKIINHPKLNTLTIETDAENPAWGRLTDFSIQGCDLVDTLKIFRDVDEHIRVYLPDLKWTLTVDDLEVSGSVVNKISILQKLIECHGEGNIPACRVTEGGNWDYNNLITNRTYVGGTIYLPNRAYELDENNEKVYTEEGYGIDEVELYNKYGVYYPNIKFVYEECKHNVKGYTLSAYNVAGELIQGYPRKLKSNEVDTKFSFDSCFTENGAYYLAPSPRNSTPEYSYEFCGWNTTGLLTFEEKDYQIGSVEQNIAEARKDAFAAVIVAYNENTKEYSLANGFDMSTAFSKANPEIILYPTYVAVLRSYTVKFDDGLGNGEDSIFETQEVRFGSNAVEPSYQPSKVRLPSAAENFANSKEGYISPFKNYGAEILGPITGPKTFVCNYEEEQPMRAIASPASYFEVVGEYNGGYQLNLKSNVKAEAITIPATFTDEGYGGTKNVTSFVIQSASRNEVKNTLKRVFAQNNNNIMEIASNSFQFFSQLEYVDLENMKKLETISSSAFKECSSLYLDILPDSVTHIMSNAFQNTPKLRLKQLPKNLITLSQAAFATSGLTKCDLSTATNLKIIGANAFQYCYNLILTKGLPSSIEGIGREAFSGCYVLSLNVNAEDYQHLISIGTFGFNDAGVVIKSLPETLEYIGSYSFANLKQQGSVLAEIPASVTYLGQNAFSAVKMAPEDGELLFNNPNIVILANDADTVGYSASAFQSANGYKKLLFVSESSLEAVKGTNGLGSGISDSDLALA